jgi:hypothetical protein
MHRRPQGLVEMPPSGSTAQLPVALRPGLPGPVTGTEPGTVSGPGLAAAATAAAADPNLNRRPGPGLRPPGPGGAQPEQLSARRLEPDDSTSSQGESRPGCARAAALRMTRMLLHARQSVQLELESRSPAGTRRHHQ